MTQTASGATGSRRSAPAARRWVGTVVTVVLVVVEDHRIEGGLGAAVLDALAATGPIHGRVVKVAVTDLPGSGTPEELRAWAGIDAASIAARAEATVAG